MKEKLVSVVLPVYKVEKYLDRCVDSVVNQTYRNLEILLIDDGSPDDCPRLCDSWARRDSRIRVIHKQNQGLGMARNTGIEAATGEYICFFDSDDYVLPHTIGKALERITAVRADVAVFGLRNLDAQGREVSSYPPSVGEVTYQGAEVLERFLPQFIAPEVHADGSRTFYMSSCVLLYRLDMIRESGWRFATEREIISEDVYSLLSLFRAVKSVTVIPEALYCYCQNETSLSRSYKPNRYQSVVHFYQESVALCRRLGYSEEILLRVAKPYLSFTIAAMKQEVDTDRPFGEKFKAVKAIMQDAVLQDALRRHKPDKFRREREVLFFCIRHRLYLCGFFLLSAKNGRVDQKNGTK